MKYYISLFFLVVFVFLGNKIMGQKKALALPKAFERPILQEGYDLSSTKETTKTPWIVICDRTGRQTFEQISNHGNLEGLKTKLRFKDCFYVSEQKGDFIRLFKGKVNSTNLKVEGNTEDYGWINKQHILLWTNALVSSKNKVQLKAFFKINPISTAQISNIKKSVKVYKGPDTRDVVGHRSSDGLYFILKKEEDRVLLSTSDYIHPPEHVSNLLGWVRQTNVETWNTKLCLEPNFQEAAFLERKNNPDVQFIAYAEETRAVEHAETGRPNREQAVWMNDPVTLKSNDLANGSRRFKGGTIRFPVLNVQSDYIRSGMVGHFTGNELVSNEGASVSELSEVDLKMLQQLQRQGRMGKKNFNVLFIIEGTKFMTWYQETIKATITAVTKELVKVPTVRYGASVYRDTPEKVENKLFDFQKMTSSSQTILDFVSEIEFDRWQEDEDYNTAMYYGIRETIAQAQLNPEHTNIVFVIGSNGDLHSNTSRKTDESFVATAALAQQLADVNAHIIGLQCKSTGQVGMDFAKNLSDLMLQTAENEYKTYESSLNKSNPFFLKAPNISEEFKLVSSLNTGQIVAAPNNGSLKEEEVVNKATIAVKRSYTFANNFAKKVNTLLPNSSSSTSRHQAFAPSAANIWWNITEESEKNGITSADFKKVIEQKYKFYTEVYIPRKIEGAKHDLSSLVLLMTVKDLEDYIDVLDQLAIDMLKSEEETREGLYRALVTLYENHFGTKELPKQYSTKDLRADRIGVSKRVLPSKNNVRDIIIEDVLSEKKMSIRKIRLFCKSMVHNATSLKRIINKGKSYEFSYTDKHTTYFWIPIEHTF